MNRTDFPGDRLACVLGGDRHGLKLGVVGDFRFGGRDVADRLEQATVVEPVDPFEDGELDGFEIAPRPSAMDELGFEQPVDRLGQDIVVAVADTADGGLNAGLGQPFGVAKADVL